MKLRKKNILIVGGTGFIGYHLAKACLSKNLMYLVFLALNPKQLGLIEGKIFHWQARK